MANECIVFIGMCIEYYIYDCIEQSKHILFDGKIPLANTDTQKMNNKANFR